MTTASGLEELMDGVSATAVRDGDPWPALPDVSALPIAALDDNDDSVLGRALRRVLAGLADRDGVISAFGSFVSDE
ncbi:MAG: FxSxx-COOH cyclophane-containing RiPP peptide [Actinoplanes sp.]